MCIIAVFDILIKMPPLINSWHTCADFKALRLEQINELHIIGLPERFFSNEIIRSGQIYSMALVKMENSF